MCSQGSSNPSSLLRPTASTSEHGYTPSAAPTQPVADLHGLGRLVSPVSPGLHTSPQLAGLIQMSVCCMESLGGNLRHKLWVEILTVSLVPWFSPCLTCTFHRGCLCIAYRISPRDCCFVTFCTIVLAGFVLHAVLKKIFHTILCLFFPNMFIPSLTKSRVLQLLVSCCT